MYVFYRIEKIYEKTCINQNSFFVRYRDTNYDPTMSYIELY